jgi:hypothetical protein
MQQIVMAQAQPASSTDDMAMFQTVPVAHSLQLLQNRDGCATLRCIHITLLIFGVFNLILAILNFLTSNIMGLIFGLLTGILGIVPGAMMNTCGCCSDPGLPGTVKCISIMSIINSVLHVIEMGWHAYWTAIIIRSQCYSCSPDGFIGCFCGLVIAILTAFIIWYFVSFVICVVAAVNAWKAWKETSKMSSAEQLI